MPKTSESVKFEEGPKSCPTCGALAVTDYAAHQPDYVVHVRNRCLKGCRAAMPLSVKRV